MRKSLLLSLPAVLLMISCSGKGDKKVRKEEKHNENYIGRTVYSKKITLKIKVNKKMYNGKDWDMFSAPDVKGVIDVKNFYGLMQQKRKIDLTEKDQNIFVFNTVLPGDLIYINAWDEDTFNSYDEIGSVFFNYDGYPSYTVGLFYKGYKQAQADIKISDATPVFSVKFLKKNLTSAQVDFETKKWKKVAGTIDEDARRLLERIHELQKEIKNSSNVLRKNKLTARLSGLINHYYRLDNIPFDNKGYQIKNWKGKVFFIGKKHDVSGDYASIIAISSHIYYLFEPAGKFLPFYSRNDNIDFDGKIVRNVTYYAANKLPVWGVVLNSAVDRQAVQRYNDFYQNYNKLKNSLSLFLKDSLKHYTPLKNSYSQDEYEKGLKSLVTYYNPDVKTLNKISKEPLKEIKNILQNVRFNAYRYNFDAVKKDSGYYLFGNFIKKYTSSLDKYKVSHWSVSLDSVRNEKEKIFVTDWSKVAGTAANVLLGLWMSSKGVKTNNFDLVDLGSYQIDKGIEHKGSYQKAKLVNVTYLYGKGKYFYYKIKIPKEYYSKLSDFDKGSKVFFDGRIVAFKNNTIYVVASKIY